MTQRAARLGRFPGTAIGIVLLLQVIAAGAQTTLYVGDSLKIGLHAKPSLESPIEQLLPTGSVLQLIERNGALAKVRTESGKEGWVDGSFVSETLPAQLRVQTMEAELAGAQAALADLQAKMVRIEQRPEQVASERAADESGKLSSEALREMQLLAEENQRLKQQLAELSAVERMRKEVAAKNVSAAPADGKPGMSDHGDDDDVIRVSRLKQWHLLLLASILLLAFAIGGWLVDWGIRRRHGGFRV